MKSELLDAWLRDELAPDEQSRVEAAIQGDSALREVAMQQLRTDMALSQLLADEFTLARESSELADGVMAHLSLEESAPSNSLAKSVLTEILEERKKIPRPFSGWDWLKAGAVAAVAMIGTLFFLKSVHLRPDPAVVEAKTNARFVAQIAGESNADWDREGMLVDLRDDGWLNPSRLRLRSGIAEISFNSGARIFLEGPAVLDISSAERAFLEQGSLTAEVPPAASGFVVNTPRLTVVDIGTRFGVSVVDDGDTEVHVMQGLVEVNRSSGNSVAQLLREGNAVRADARTRSAIQEIPYDGVRFGLRLPVGTPVRGLPASFVHYGFDETGEPSLEDSGRGFSSSPLDGSLMPSETNPETPRRAPGQVGSALSFTAGATQSLPVAHELIEGDAFTIAAWVKLPVQGVSGTKSQSTILGVGGIETDRQWSVAWNVDANLGELGALQIACGDGLATGSTDLRDGRWHHIAFRFLGGTDSNVSTHTHLYVDGKLEPLSEAVGATPFSDARRTRVRELVLGRDLSTAAEDATFEGWIDEFHLFHSALSVSQIQSLASQSNDSQKNLDF